MTYSPKTPRDPIEHAKLIIDIAAGEIGPALLV